MTETLEFTVQGSKGDKYHVAVRRAGGNLTATCTCRAGQNGVHCKHRMALLVGDVSNLISDNDSDVTALAEIIKGTDVETALKSLAAAEEALQAAKGEVSQRKKALSRALND